MSASLKDLLSPTSESVSSKPSGSVGMPSNGSIPTQPLSADFGKAHTEGSSGPKGQQSFPSAGTKMPCREPGSMSDKSGC